MKTATLRQIPLAPSNSQPLQYNQIMGCKIKVPVKLRKATREKAMENALTYRIPLEVAQILKFPNEYYFPVCPRCKSTVEREYMRFCDRCGQKLGWSKLKEAVIVYPGYRSATKKDRRRHLSLF